MDGAGGDTADAQPVYMEQETTDARSGGRGIQSTYTGHPNTIPSEPFEHYKMNNKQRGMAVIINNRTFDPSTQMNERRGTDIDAASLFERFKDLGFKVHVFHNRTVSQMKEIMFKAANQDHTDSDAFVCAMLSHGDEGVIYGTDGTVAIDDLVAPFKGDICRSLAGKPKLFFIQACRGNKLDHGVEVFDDGSDIQPMEEEIQHRIPAEADFLMAYSVVPGYFSWRNSTKGSWFCQALSQVLEQFGHMEEIMRLMTRVNRKVAFEFESNASQAYMSQKKQIPCIVSMLTKDLYFGRETKL